MEDSLEDISKQVKHIFLYEVFEKLCPYYISIGMTYEQFWYGDVSMTISYRKANEIIEKKKAIENKWARWEQGLYVYEALCDVSPILRAFSQCKKPLPFTEKPYDIDSFYEEFKDEQYKKEKEEKQKEIDKMRAQIFFENWAKTTATKFKDKKGG